MRTRRTLTVMLLLIPASLNGQEIRGRVIDDATGRDVRAVDVSLLQGKTKIIAKVVSDSTGAFVFEVPRSGYYKLRASLIGYHDMESKEFEARSDERLEVELRIASAVIALEQLRVTARTEVHSPYLASIGFYQRRQAGQGHFLTRSDIDKNNAPLLSDVLRNVPGMRLVRTDRTARRFEIAFSRSGSQRCLPALIIDGVMARTGGPAQPTILPLDNMVRPGDIEAIELYHGPSQLPVAYNREAVCGTIAIWTKRRS